VKYAEGVRRAIRLLSARGWPTRVAYFPEWLQETATELIAPIPRLQDVLDQSKGAEVKDRMGTTYIVGWQQPLRAFPQRGQALHGIGRP